jgi:hypothetical protein
MSLDLSGFESPAVAFWTTLNVALALLAATTVAADWLWRTARAEHHSTRPAAGRPALVPVRTSRRPYPVDLEPPRPTPPGTHRTSGTPPPPRGTGPVLRSSRPLPAKPVDPDRTR